MSGWEFERTSADGALRAWTSYGDDGPIATVIPFKRPLHSERIGPTTDVRLSRFAYLHRRGRVMLLQTPLSGVEMELHHPSAGAMLAALNFDMNAERLAAAAQVSLATAIEFVNQLVAMSAAFPVAHRRDPSAVLASLGEWALQQGIPGTWDRSELHATLRNLPWDRISDHAELILELHHDGSRRVDVSIAVHVPRERAVLTSMSGQEFDVTETGPELMGTFDGVRPLPPFEDALDWTQRAINETEADSVTNLRVQDNPALRALVEVLGAPGFIGTMVRRKGVRLLFEIKTPGQLVEASAVLAAHGIPDSVAQRLGLLTPLLGERTLLRLAVDAFPDSIAPAIGIEAFIDDRVRITMPGVLDALGIDAEVLTEILDLVGQDQKLRRLVLVPGVVTDVQTLSPLHVKVSFAADGEVSAKTYVSVSNAPLSTEGRTEEDGLIPGTWEFHDLLFHSQTREGRVRHRLGRTDRFGLASMDVIERIPPPLGDVVLPLVDIASTVSNDPPFGVVLRERTSIRDWTGPEIPLEGLTELLARVQEIIPRSMEFAGLELDWSGAPYPSGGAVYETDIVVLAHRVTGLDPGSYLYRRVSASLKPLNGSLHEVDELLVAAGQGCGAGNSRPQALLVLAARFPDLAVKYEGIAYSLMLKHVGVLMATVAYTATAMGLGAVPIGTGNSDTFVRATGLDYYRHGSIGEIALTVPPDESST